jgi:hypothetical protein
MKKRNLKQISLALVLVMALGMLLSACGGSGPNGMKQSSTPSEAPAASNSFVAMDNGWSYGMDASMEAPVEAESWSEESMSGGSIDSIKNKVTGKAEEAAAF